MGDQRRFQEAGVKGEIYVATFLAQLFRKTSRSKILSARFAKKNEVRDAE